MFQLQGGKSYHLLMSTRITKNLKAFFILCLLIVATSACAASSSNVKDVTYFTVRSAEGSGIMDCSGNWVVEPRTDGFFSNLMVNGLAPFYDASQIATPFSYINS
ncbi:MAG: hypothetical protein ACYC59_07930, partial [Anaerolineaceae bacterium]